MRLEDAKRKAIQIIREYTRSGALVSIIENADYLMSMNDFADIAQKEVAARKRIRATYAFTHRPVPNLLGELSGFDTIHCLGESITHTESAGAKAYYFEVDGEAQVLLQERVQYPGNSAWVILDTINTDAKGAFKAYKGLVDASDASNPIRLVFDGGYPYAIRNRALYGVRFKDTASVPQYAPWVGYQLPEDFMELDRVVLVGQIARQGMKNYDWENKRTIIVNYFCEGEVRVQYYRYPTTINKNTNDSYAFEVDPEAQECIPFFMAARSIMDEDRNLAVTILNEYQIRLASLTDDEDKGIAVVQDLKGWL